MAKKNSKITAEELKEKLGLLTITSDIVTEHAFKDNKNNDIVTEIANEIQKIYDFELMPMLQETTVQRADAPEVLKHKKMVADFTGYAVKKKFGRIKAINLGMEIQKQPQSDFPERIILSFSNRTKIGFKSAAEYKETPDVIQIGIATAKLKKLTDNKNFVSCIDMFTIRETGKPLFKDDKYQMFLIELSKMPKTKDKLDKKYHALWDICKVLKTSHKDMERMIEMAAITNPTALKLSRELKKAVTSPEVVEWEERRLEALRERNMRIAKIKSLENELQKEQQARQKEQQAKDDIIAQMRQQMLDAGLTPIPLQPKETTKPAPQKTVFTPNKPKSTNKKTRSTER